MGLADEVRAHTIYGLHGAVYTNDVDRARDVASRIRTGAIGHNGFKSDFDMGHGGFPGRAVLTKTPFQKRGQDR